CSIGAALPDSRSEAHSRSRIQRRCRGGRGSLAPGEGRSREDADRVEHPGTVRVNVGDVDAAFAHAKKIVEATYSTPYLPRARMEPGNATVLVTDNRV